MDAPAVLLVDDVHANLVALEAVIHDLDCTVVTARSGEEALRLLLRQEFALLLLDVQMPGMDGFEVARHVRMRSATADVGIIFVTAFESKQSALRGYDEGGVDFIFKPIDREILRSKVRAFLELHASRRKLADANARLEASHAQVLALAEAEASAARQARSKNEELRAAYAELRSTQANLVQAAKMASLGVLVAGVAHEVNNPLTFAMSHVRTAIKSFDQLHAAADGVDSAAFEAAWQCGRERLNETGLGLERIRDLVQKLRTFSRLDEDERKSVSVRESVDAVLAILRHRFEPRIDVRVRLSPPDTLECVPSLLNQVLLNLVANAIDAIKGEGTVQISAGAEGSEFLVRVADSGSGISPAARERLFEPFFTTKPVGEGTGLGLAISYSIVKKHGGSLELIDAPGGGTLALIRVPLRDAERALSL
jgi:two-component system NtrC family sensor kinase